MNYFGSCRKPGVAEQQIKADLKALSLQHQGFEGINIKNRVNQEQYIVKGWKNTSLLTSYKLNKATLYFNFDSSSTRTAD
jgi:hypothetical protein